MPKNKHGKPESLNTDQGSQFTSEEFTRYVTQDLAVRQRINGKGRAIDTKNRGMCRFSSSSNGSGSA